MKDLQKDPLYALCNRTLEEKKFADLCKRIESDPNFQDECTDEQLLKLVRENEQSTMEAAIMIQAPYSLSTAGKPYLITRAMYGIPVNSGYYIDEAWSLEKNVLLVRSSCKVFTFKYQGLGADDLPLFSDNNHPCETNINAYLSQHCIHTYAAKEKSDCGDMQL